VHRIPGLHGAATWSAFGHYIVATAGDQLWTVDRSGRVAWRQRHDGPVADARWSPDGNRIAFRVGRTLHVTAGDGTGRHAVGPPPGLAIAPVAPAWRPGPGHVVAVVTAGGRIAVVDVDTGRILRRLAAPPRALAVQWTAAGDLVVVGAHDVRALRPGSGGVAWRRAAPAGTRYVAGTAAADGRRTAVVERQTRGGEVAVLLDARGRPRTLIGDRRLGAVRFSPDGRWLLVGWPVHDSWLFFATGTGDRRVVQVTGIGRRFGGAEVAIRDWCCAPRPVAARGGTG
jgi:dipeptidyl aminopeptidase/acylaminoacyl peptidase